MSASSTAAVGHDQVVSNRVQLIYVAPLSSGVNQRWPSIKCGRDRPIAGKAVGRSQFPLTFLLRTARLRMGRACGSIRLRNVSTQLKEKNTGIYLIDLIEFFKTNYGDAGSLYAS